MRLHVENRSILSKKNTCNRANTELGDDRAPSDPDQTRLTAAMQGDGKRENSLQTRSYRNDDDEKSGKPEERRARHFRTLSGA